MNGHVGSISELTRNQTLVMSALTGSGGPLSAYTILDRLRDQGFRAPLQVYRALEKLVEFGLVHRLECLDAFVACRHPCCDSLETIAFMICERCKQVDEVSDHALAQRLDYLATEAGFTLRKSAVELRGVCSACRVA